MTRKTKQRLKAKQLPQKEIARLEGTSIDDLKIEREKAFRRIAEVIHQYESGSKRSPDRGGLDDALREFHALDQALERIIENKRAAGEAETSRKSDDDKKIEKLIASWERRFPKDQYIFRGQRCNKWDVTSTLYRSLHEIRDENSLPEKEKRIITAGRYVNPPHTLDTEIITDLQHFGGMTNCIDFTNEIHVALYFACRKLCGTGAILIIRHKELPAANLARFDAVTSYDSEGPMRIISPSARASNIERVSSQESVFLQVEDGCLERSQFTKIEDSGSEEQEDFKVITIKEDEKPRFLKYLEKYYVERYWGILQDTMGIIDKDRSFEETKGTRMVPLSKLKHYDNLEEKKQELATLASKEVMESRKPPISSHYYIGLIFYSRGNYKQAVNSLHRAAHRSEQEPPNLYLFLASAFIRLGEYQAAEERLAKVQDCDRGHLHSFIAADMHFKMGNYLCAWREIKRAVKLNEGSWSYLRLKIIIASKLYSVRAVKKFASQYLKNCSLDPEIAKLYGNAKKGECLHSNCGARERGKKQ